jgi:hypothetical protein
MAVSREDLMRIKRELAEKSAKAFAADFVRWLRTGAGAIPFEGADGKKDELFLLRGKRSGRGMRILLQKRKRLSCSRKRSRNSCTGSGRRGSGAKTSSGS